MKPRLFIGSSKENLGVAKALQAELDFDGEVTVWSQGIFRLSETTLHSLLTRLSTFEFAAFVLAPEDVAQIRNDTYHVARDNVILELGLFIGKLGIERTFMVVPKNADLHLPTDLLGITMAEYDASRQDENLQAALGLAGTLISQQMNKLSTQLPAGCPYKYLPTEDAIWTEAMNMVDDADPRDELLGTTSFINNVKFEEKVLARAKCGQIRYERRFAGVGQSVSSLDAVKRSIHGITKGDLDAYMIWYKSFFSDWPNREQRGQKQQAMQEWQGALLALTGGGSGANPEVNGTDYELLNDMFLLRSGPSSLRGILAFPEFAGQRVTYGFYTEDHNLVLAFARNCDRLFKVRIHN